MKQIFYISFFFVVIVNAQTPDKGEVTYLDFNQKPTNKENAFYYEFRTPYKNDIIKYQKYFIYSTTKAYLVKKYYLDKEGKKQGKYLSFYNTGQIRREGIYLNNVKNGPWKYYNILNIKKPDSILNKSSLTDIESYNNGLKEGAFQEYHYNGNNKGEGSYKNDVLFGECKWYHQNGQLSSYEFYNENGKIDSIIQWNENGTLSKGKLKPLKGPIKDKNKAINSITQRISKNFNKTLLRNNNYEQGKVFVGLKLSKEGTIENLHINSTSKIPFSFEKEIKRIINNIKTVEKSYYHNQLVDVYLRFSVSFTDSKSITRIRNSNKNFARPNFNKKSTSY